MAMQLRSGRRVASPVPGLPAPGGDLRRVRPRRSQDGGDDDDSKDDLISRLPKDMRLEVLARLPCTREAVRTSVLSEPWRCLWTELRELTLDGVADLDSLLGALAQVQPKLDRLCIRIPSDDDDRVALGGASISSLLRAADKLEPLELAVRVCGIKHRRRGSPPLVLLPCFARATSIELRVRRLRFKLPRAGSFASLERLEIFVASFVDPGVFLPRCPRLRKLVMDGGYPRCIAPLAFESSSLHELVWYLNDVELAADVHVVAPNLRSFVFSSFSRKLMFTISSLSAPKLQDLYLECFLEDSMVGFIENVRWRLYELRLEMRPERSSADGDGDGRQHVLSLCIDNVLVLPPVHRSFEQEVARLRGTLANFSALELNLRTEGHVFGALVLRLLRIRTDIQRLKVVLLRVDEKCWEHCDCDFASNWRDELISLPRLEVAEFIGFRGHDHEMDFVKLLVGSAASLKTMTIQHFNEVSIVSGACQKLHSMFSANASVSFSFS